MEIKVKDINMSGFFLLIAAIVMEASISLQQECMPIIFSSQAGYALVGKEYKSWNTKDYPTCLKECDKDKRCMSLNFHLVTKKCDLNSQTNDSLPKIYKKIPNSIYLTNTAFRIPEPVKGTTTFPAKSCLDILVSGDSFGTGVYWIDPSNLGNPIEVFCDMATDGGGWTIVKKLTLQSSTPLPNVVYETYDVMKCFRWNDKNIVPRGAAMLDILQKMGFYQIHFYCHKKSVGRVVSIMTKNNTAAGQDVVKFFTNDTYASTTFPDACGSFDRLPEDTSILAQNCQRWGWDGKNSYEVNKWASLVSTRAARLATRPFTIEGSNEHMYGCYKTNKKFYCSCDDSIDGVYGTGDKWQIAVR